MAMAFIIARCSGLATGAATPPMIVFLDMAAKTFSAVTGRFGELDRALLIGSIDRKISIFGRASSSPRVDRQSSDHGVRDLLPFEEIVERTQHLVELHGPRVALAGLMH